MTVAKDVLTWFSVLRKLVTTMDGSDAPAVELKKLGLASVVALDRISKSLAQVGNQNESLTEAVRSTTTRLEDIPVIIRSKVTEVNQLRAQMKGQGNPIEKTKLLGEVNKVNTEIERLKKEYAEIALQLADEQRRNASDARSIEAARLTIEKAQREREKAAAEIEGLSREGLDIAGMAQLSGHQKANQAELSDLQLAEKQREESDRIDRESWNAFEKGVAELKLSIPGTGISIPGESAVKLFRANWDKIKKFVSQMVAKLMSSNFIKSAKAATWQQWAAYFSAAFILVALFYFVFVVIPRKRQEKLAATGDPEEVVTQMTPEAETVDQASHSPETVQLIQNTISKVRPQLINALRAV